MSQWPSKKARVVYRALLRIDWKVKFKKGSHIQMERPGWPDLTFAFHEDEEIGPKMLARFAKQSGLRPTDL